MNESKSARPLTKRQRYWLEHLDAWRSEGGPLTVYARAHGLRIKSLYYWRGKEAELRGEETRPIQPPRFSRVEVSPVSSRGEGDTRPLRVCWPNGVRVEWPQGLSEAALMAVLHALGDAS